MYAYFAAAVYGRTVSAKVNLVLFYFVEISILWSPPPSPDPYYVDLLFHTHTHTQTI
jgi:hypothetical protein